MPGYAAALEAFDAACRRLMAALRDGDLVVVTADHGNDPTWTGTDHTREQVPIVGLRHGQAGRDVGRRCYADIGETVAAHLGLPPGKHGKSFL